MWSIQSYSKIRKFIADEKCTQVPQVTNFLCFDVNEDLLYQFLYMQQSGEIIDSFDLFTIEIY